MSDGQEAPKLIILDGVEYVSTTALQDIERRLKVIEENALGPIDLNLLEARVRMLLEKDP